MKKAVELKSENGSLNAYCANCGAKLSATTEKLRELASSGEFGSIDVLCPKCSMRMKADLQLGFKEVGKYSNAN